MKRATIALLLICTAVFAQEKGTGTFTDSRDKKKYKTVNIGDLTWMAENLSYNAKGSKCPGEDDNKDESVLCLKNDAIVEGCVNIDCSEWGETSDYMPFCKKYKNLTAKQVQDKKKAKDKEIQTKCAKEGRQYSNLKDNNVCPTGWRLPSQSEWDILRRAISSGTDEHGFQQVSGFRVADGGSVRCVQESKEYKAALEKARVDVRDKKQYKAVKIGEQVWMAENLNFNAEGSKCYDDKPENCKKYGRLYGWLTAMKLPSVCGDNNCSNQIRSKHQGICPDGWHIPSSAELNELMTAVGGKSSAGAKLKAKSGWNNGTDEFGFSALPGGYVKADGGFDAIDKSGLWWSAHEFNNYYTMSNARDDVYIGNVAKNLSLSVRCVYGSASDEVLPPVPTPAPAKAPAAAPAQAPAAQPANNPSKTMYCVSYVTGKPVSCMELKDTQDGKKLCDTQSKNMKMMLGEAKLTETKPSINCVK
ncbi:MAG: fibrobacter succinogenes major paralogous domain-containing protein [Candidatus Fibromonas sp.]|jgi:uncharacterized protein (TIGR02145 family)|nr:fibrobacter succinogenes major paralogous domain-containing protein [Candidatus Fibromonas sp.]